MRTSKTRRRSTKSPVRKVPPPKTPVLGYCWSKEHKGYLTKKAIDQHGCLKKNCPRFEKRNSTYWDERKIANIKKKLRKYYRKYSSLYSKFISAESFVSSVERYYGSLGSVPYEEGTGIDLSEFLGSLEQESIKQEN